MNILIHHFQKLFTRTNLNKINVFGPFRHVNVKQIEAKFTTPNLIAHKSIPDDSTNHALTPFYLDFQTGRARKGVGAIRSEDNDFSPVGGVF